MTGTSWRSLNVSILVTYIHPSHVRHISNLRNYSLTLTLWTPAAQFGLRNRFNLHALLPKRHSRHPHRSDLHRRVGEYSPPQLLDLPEIHPGSERGD